MKKSDMKFMIEFVDFKIKKYELKKNSIPNKVIIDSLKDKKQELVKEYRDILRAEYKAKFNRS